MYFDTHCHLTLCDHVSLEEHISLLREHNVKKVIDPGIFLEDFALRHEKLKKYPEVLLSVAIAPHFIEEAKDYQASLKKLDQYLQTNKEIVAVGEIGLDYFHAKNENVKAKQKELFYNQLILAKKYDLPVFLHIREAFKDAYEVVKSSGHRRGALHCFTGDVEDAKNFLDWGFYISFSGIVTFNKSKKLQEISKNIPEDRLLTETDSPYLSPVPHRGKKNFSHYVAFINRFLADLRGLKAEVLDEKLWNNAHQLLAMKKT